MSPTRRQTLSAVSLLAVVGAGCLDSTAPDDGSPGVDDGSTAPDDESGGAGDDEPTEILATEFETGVSNVPDARDPPEVTHEDGRIVVEGSLFTGSTCYDAVGHSRGYDEEADELELRIGTASNDQEECEDIDQLERYRFVVEYDGSPPGIVRVSEDRGEEIEVPLD